MGTNELLPHFENLVESIRHVPLNLLAGFLKSSVMVDILGKLGDSYFGLAIETLKSFNSYLDEREACTMLLNNLMIAHHHLYQQRVEFYKNISITSIDTLFMSGFNLYQIRQNRYKEAYAACLLAIIHFHLGNGNDLIREKLSQGIYAVHDHPLYEKDKEYFFSTDTYSKISDQLSIPLLSIGYITNPKNWVEEDEEAKQEAVIQQIIRLAEHLDKLNNIRLAILMNEINQEKAKQQKTSWKVKNFFRNLLFE